MMSPRGDPSFWATAMFVVANSILVVDCVKHSNPSPYLTLICLEDS